VLLAFEYVTRQSNMDMHGCYFRKHRDRVKEWHGDDDYEYWVDVPASEIEKLVLLLLQERYNGKLDAVSEFMTFCETKGITHKFMTWT
jgi:hypothetical protein